MSVSALECPRGKDSQSSIHMEDVVPTPPQESTEYDSYAMEDPANPRNWPAWKKNAQILMVAFHSLSATFVAAGIIPAYDTLAEEYGITVPQASYLTSAQILLFGIAPFGWKPITAIYGRYHVFMFSVFGAMLCNIGSARSTTFGAQMTARVLGAILISPPFGIGSGVITDLCEPEHRAQKLGWWTLMLTLGTPCGPFIMGFVTQHIGVEWIFWIFTIVNFVQLLLYVAIGEETLYIPAQRQHRDKIARRSFLTKFIPRRIDPRPLRAREFIEPLFLSRHTRVLIPAIAHCVVFCYANIVLIVEMPIAFGEKFHFNAQQIGLQFIAIIIGCVLGEQLSGPMSDWFLIAMKRRRKGGEVHQADRLWLSYIGYATVIAGLLVWGFQLEKADEGEWNVTPCVGAAIASFGNQVITTILISFAVDSYKDQSTDVGVCINLYRQIYGFIGPFYFPHMFETLKLSGAAGVMCGIVAFAALLPTAAIQFAASRRL
ncbi:major facilitator superfamily domain-containing protein [Aspergillus pseudoustus]|uniref:Major facilitator superfamily domain-containing protein n=1 Tax=Aspergillus pseudoustus TaxID=1810923 RepID=A0ABR4IG88_9EURO